VYVHSSDDSEENELPTQRASWNDMGTQVKLEGTQVKLEKSPEPSCSGYQPQASS